MSNPNRLPGKFVWFELVSKDVKKAQTFYGEVFGWKVQQFPMANATYEMIYAGDTMIGSYAATRSDREPSYWLSCVSVEDVDAAARAAAVNGGKVIEAPSIFRASSAGRASRTRKGLNFTCSTISGAINRTHSQPLTDVGCGTSCTPPIRPRPSRFTKRCSVFPTARWTWVPTAYHIVSQGGVDRGGVTHYLMNGVRRTGYPTSRWTILTRRSHGRRNWARRYPWRLVTSPVSVASAYCRIPPVLRSRL